MTQECHESRCHVVDHMSRKCDTRDRVNPHTDKGYIDLELCSTRRSEPPGKTKQIVINSWRRCDVVSTDDGRFGSKVGDIGPKWDKSDSFSVQISVHLARGHGMRQISEFIK